MADLVWPLPPGRRPFLRTEGALGTRLLRNSRPDADGWHFATHWFMIIFFPIVPLGRYYVRKGQSTGVTTVVTKYEIAGRSRLRLVELIRTYLFLWVVFPFSFVGPIVAVMELGYSGAGGELLGIVTAVVGLVFFAILWQLYRQSWQPVREPRWVTARPV